MPLIKNSLDNRAILDASLRLFGPWLASVLIVTWAGYPGVVCVTPMAWLIALAVGVRVARHSASSEPRQRVLEAALAGALLGLLQWLLFLFILPRLGTIQPDELISAGAIILGALCFGVPAAAGLAAFTAWQVQLRASNL